MAIKRNNKLLDVLVNNLAEQGEKAIKKAYETREYHNKLYNLHDSYGSAVYVNGVLQPKTIRYEGGTMAHKPKKYQGQELKGREEAERFLRGYKPDGDGVQLVIVAAMFYAGILEHQGGNIQRTYKVISGGLDVLTDLASQYKGASVYRISSYDRFNG